MKVRHILLTCSLAAALPLAAQNPKPPDNSAANKDQSTTADKQSMQKSDTEMSRKIRKAITSDSSMSTYARNVKVVTTGGHVTIKGPVRTEEEKTSVLAKAKEIAGDANVTDEVTIAPKK